MTRVLIIRFSSMGDVILTTPVVRALHAMLEGEVEVHYLTKAPFAEAVRGLAGVHRVWTIEKTTAEIESELQEVGFHYVVDLHANARSGFVKRALRSTEGGALDLTVDKRSLDKILLVRTGWDRLQGQHVVERYLKTLAPFGDALNALSANGDQAGLRLPAVGVAGGGSGAGLGGTDGGGGGVVLALGAAHVGKAIPEAHWATIIKGLQSRGKPVHLLGGPAEQRLAVRLSESAEGPVHIHCGDTGWSKTFEVISDADVLVAGDTGAMHAGAALNTPMVVVWGCTSPALGMGPWRANPAVIQLEPEAPTRSRPCSRLGDRCRHKTPCIERVSPARILEAVDALFSQTAP